METPWSEERMDRLATLYRNGWSFSMIAAEIGLSRNAVIGKAHRMKLPDRFETVQCLPHPRHRRRKTPAKSVARHKIEVRQRPALSPEPRYHCSIIDLGNRSCRYPMWHGNAAPNERFYCGCPDASVADGISYCREHALLCQYSRA